MVYFHGGGWKFGKPEQFKASILPFHKAGYPVILPSVRRTPWSNYYDMRADLNHLLLAILKLQQEEKLGNQKIVLGGMSAGGNLAALLCYDKHALAEIGQDQSLFAGLLACGAALDLNKMRQSIVLHAFANSKTTRQFSLANPINHVSESEPIPILCIHGDQDGLVEYKSTLSFINVVKKHHLDMVSFTTLTGGTHLDTAAWSIGETKLKGEILDWAQKL